jgi:hypothetical protein
VAVRDPTEFLLTFAFRLARQANGMERSDSPTGRRINHIAKRKEAPRWLKPRAELLIRIARVDRSSNSDSHQTEKPAHGP